MKVIKKILAVVLIIILISSYGNAIAEENHTKDETKMYFLAEVTKSIGNGDCILLENNGKFALIDTGKETTQEKVVQYLQAKGVKQLEFMLITHGHSDHIGAAVKVMETFPIKKLYIKEYDENYVKNPTKGVQATYKELLKLAQSKNIEIMGIANIGTAFNLNNTKFTFGTANIQILNWEMKCNEDGTRKIVEDENENSMGVLITQGNQKAFLAGDINNTLGDETRLAPVIGKVDFLKLAHHGYINSNTENFLQTLKPDYAVITNDYYRPYTNTIKLLEQLKTQYHYSTQDNTGVIVKISNNDVEVEYENLDGWKFIMGKWRQFKNGVELTKEIKAEQTVSSWDELSKVISTGESRTIKLKNSENWIANKKITVAYNQQITLLSEESIQITRADTYKGIILSNEGILNIGIENMLGSITIDGNKNKVEAQGSMVSNTGILNISNKTTLRNNKLVDNGTCKGSAIDNRNTYSQLNILGGIIENNEIDVRAQYTYQNVTRQDIIRKGVYGGAISVDKGTLTMIEGAIRNNKMDNHSVLKITNSNLASISTTTYGGAIHSAEGNISIIGTTIENNTSDNHTVIKVTDSTVNYMNSTCRGGAISINNTKLNIDNYTSIKNNQVDTHTQLTKKGSKINTEDISEAVGGGIYAYHGEIEINQSNITQNQAAVGGAISTSIETNIKMIDTNIEQNKATKNAGGIFIEPESNCEIIGGYFAGNTANELGNAIYQKGQLEIGGNVKINDTIYINNGRTIKVKEELTGNSTILIQYPKYSENQEIIENNTKQDIINKIVVLGQNQYYLEQKNNKIILVNQNKRPTTIKIQYSTQKMTHTAVTVTVQADREIQAMPGWDKINNMQIKKTYTKNTDETIQVIDILGNKKEIPIKISNIYKIRRY